MNYSDKKTIIKNILLILFTFGDILFAILFLPLPLANTYIILSLIGKGIVFLSEILAYLFTGFKSHLFTFFVLQLAIGSAFWLFREEFAFAGQYLQINIVLSMCFALMRLLSLHGKLSFLAEVYHFFIPRKKSGISKISFLAENVAIIIPAYKPTHMTISLIKSILSWHPHITIVVVDDNTPLTDDTRHTLYEITKLSRLYTNLHVIRSHKNRLKAGALNKGLTYLKSLPIKPETIFTMDDDIQLTERTLPNMLTALYEDTTTGAVCSQVKVINKEKNLLTRMQALEYHNFNVTKIADTGFLQGPLVMQGMLTVFRMKVLEQTKGFTEGHLIEDYDITARIKQNGWRVTIAQNAVAWTLVPESLTGLWKQRARWTSGGLYVLATYWKYPPSVYQDIIGHGLFLTLFSLVSFSFFFSQHHAADSMLASFVYASAMISLGALMFYNFAVIFVYPDRDIKDWLIKLTILPEFIYANFLSLILYFSYVYAAYTLFAKTIFFIISSIHKLWLFLFDQVGFSPAWGTRR